MTSDPELPGARPSPTLSGRTVAGRYRVIGLLGQGGIGRVYAAEQVGMDRRVAVKVIRPERRGDPVTTARFLREARAAGRIQSPNVVTLYDFGEDGGRHYLAMELLEGRSLEERLRDGVPMELSEILHVATSIARGLRAAHEAGVLHRDLKPANVFLCDDGTVKVLDFGIAKLLDEGGSEWEPLTAVNRILGTPVYMSPEAATRRPLGPTADLYALGLLIHAMVVGEPPFRTGDAMKTLQAQVTRPAPRLREAAPWMAVPSALDALVAGLLEKDPRRRPRDAGEVAEQLARVGDELRMDEALLHERTIVERRPPDPVWEQGFESLAEDDTDVTEVWQGARPWEDDETSAPAPFAPPALPRETLESPALRRQPPASRSAGLNGKHLAFAALLGVMLAFGGMLAARLLLG